MMKVEMGGWVLVFFFFADCPASEECMIPWAVVGKGSCACIVLGIPPLCGPISGKHFSRFGIKIHRMGFGWN